MTIDQTQVIDFLSIDPRRGKVHLTISDHLAWDRENEHLLVLQEKLNSYMAFIESGEVYASYPKAKGRDFVIDIVSKYPPNDDAVRFLELVKQSLKSSAIEIRLRQLEETLD